MPARSAFDVTSDETRRTALIEAVKFAKANGQIVVWDNSKRDYAIALYDEKTQQVQPLADDDAAILINRDPLIRREWCKWNEMTGNKGSLVVLDVVHARRVLAAAIDEGELEGLA
jgi:hypothetical protein